MKELGHSLNILYELIMYITGMFLKVPDFYDRNFVFTR